MEFDELLEILACPVCKTPVHLDAAAERIVCDSCGRRYPIRDGIPVMLVEEAEGGESGRPGRGRGARRLGAFVAMLVEEAEGGE
jgi:uncharacterized protein YbaR (Trm112 family)